MTDFIKIKESLFDKYRSSEDHKVSSKLNELLGKFQCFHDYNAFNSYKSKRPVHNQHTYVYKPNGVTHHRKKIVKEGQNDFERSITSLLNKISRKNYHNIVRQITLACTNDTSVQLVVKNILEKCQKQPCFLELYVKILHEIYMKSAFECRHCIKEQISEYIQDFIEGRNFLNFRLNSSNYDQFCFNLDNKSQIIGKHKTVIALIKEILRNSMIDEYFNIMFDEIVQMDKSQMIEEEFEKHELLLDIMTDFAKADDKYQMSITEYYTTNVEYLHTYSLKARFKILDMTAVGI